MADAAILRVQRKLQGRDQQQLIRAVVFAFADVACVAAEAGEWRPELTLAGIKRFVRTVCEDGPVEDVPANPFGKLIAADAFLWNQQIEKDIHQIKNSEKWLGYVERLAKLVKVQTRGDKPKRVDPADARSAFVRPMLTEKGWSIEDWANEANVACHTASDYLSGKKRPYPSTRAKLAKALGVSDNSLPE